MDSHRASNPEPDSMKTREHPHTNHTNTGHTKQPIMVSILRKEVIQPHLPVRLPCYDFVPITSPTFDRSPHKG